MGLTSHEGRACTVQVIDQKKVDVSAEKKVEMGNKIVKILLTLILLTWRIV